MAFDGSSSTLIALLRSAGMSDEAIQAFVARYNGGDIQPQDQGTGGTSAPSGGPAGSASSDSLSPVPFMSADPALEAQQRALERGLENLLQDTHLEKHYAVKDAAQTQHDLEVQKRRGIQDIHQERHRGLQTIDQRRQDVNLTADRNRQDFSSRLTNLIHNSSVQGDQQMQAANAAGVLDSSTTAASAAARAGNLARARAPIDTAVARTGEDQQTALGRLATSQDQLMHDTQQGAHRLRQDTHHDSRLADQQLARTIRDIHLRRQRAREEAAIGTVDLSNEMTFDARQRNPGVFSRTGQRRHPNQNPGG